MDQGFLSTVAYFKAFLLLSLDKNPILCYIGAGGKLTMKEKNTNGRVQFQIDLSPQAYARLEKILAQAKVSSRAELIK